MRIRFVLSIILLLTVVASQTWAQTERELRRASKGKSGASPDELVSFNADVPYSKAIQSLGELSKKLDGRLLIDKSALRSKDKIIGINIESMYWKDALELILRSNQLWYNDYPEYIEIVPFEEVGKQLDDQTQKNVASKDTVQVQTPGVPQAPVVVDSSEFYSKVREVNISSIFFDVNKTKLAQSGISFSFLRRQGMNLQIQFSGSEKVASQVFSATVMPRGTQMIADINAALSMFESEQLGEVIARPQLTVRSGSSSTIQIGQDFSIFEKDFSGNVVQKFYPAGTILTVRPKIYKVNDIDFIDVQYKIEKSTFEASTVTTVINKTLANSSLILLDGEEGYVGGMYSNEDVTVREGVPLLKDLPWWVFGLRYLFGYDSKKSVQRELIVLIKADILPTLEERAANRAAVKNNIIQEKKKEMEKDAERRTGKKIK
jgi:hypothetical protein